MAVFAFFSGFALLYGKASWLWRVSELNYFACGSDYLAECMRTPGGLLSWCGTFLTQFFHYPLAGTAVYIAVMLAVWPVMWRALRLSRAAFALGAVVPALMLMAFEMSGDLMFTEKLRGFPYVGLLGFAAVALIIRGYTSLPRRLAFRLPALLVLSLGYWLMGWYWVIALGIIAAVEVTDGLKGSRLMLVCAAVAVLLVWAVPSVFFYLVPDNRLMASVKWMTALPRVFEHETAMLYPYWISAACIAVLSIIMTLRRHTEQAAAGKETRNFLLFNIVTLALIAGAFHFRHTDANFDTANGMSRAIAADNYRDAADIARRHEGRPSRVVGLLTHLSLNRLGEAGDSLFAFGFADERHVSTRPDYVIRHYISRDVLLRFGRVNDAYRWCMEDMVEYGAKPEYLRTMAKAALLNGEFGLARKYAHKLGRTWFHRAEADSLLALADDPARLEELPETGHIRQLMTYGDMIAGDDSLIETYLTQSTAMCSSGAPEMLELSLQFNLVLKDIGRFWPRFIRYCDTRGQHPVPKHYQEACILYSSLEGKYDWHQFNVDPVIVKRFQRFLAMAQKYSKMSDESNLETFRPEFGDTFWYYYFFVKNIKTT